MNTYQFIKTLLGNIKYLLLIPIFIAILTYFLTMNQPQKYSSHATIFTGITSTNSIDNMSNSRVDYFATQNAYNNILSILLSKSVLEETSMRLLTSHLMLDKAEKSIISEKSFNDLQEITPTEIKKLIDKSNFELSLKNITNSIEQDKNNFVYGLLNYNHPHYSTKALSGIKVERLSSSDLIEISFQSNDPGICYNTIKVLTEVFIEKYDQIKSSQTNSAVKYFEEQLKKTAKKLKNAEDRLLVFNTQNEIINYYEQTKHVSSQQEKIEIKLQDIQLEFNAAGAVLKKLETETQNRFNINLRNREILNIREKLISVNEKIALLELQAENIGNKMHNQYLLQKRDLELSLKNKIDSIYIYESNSQGIELERILGDWLKTVMEYESAKSRLLAMEEREAEFMKQYREYAPLGAKLKRIEREIQVNEAEYLEILHHLGLARLKQQNAEMLSDMKILDEPTLPINAMATKRKIYIIVASLFSMIFCMLAIFIFELFDRRVRNISNLTKHTSTSTIGAFCLQGSHPNCPNEQLTLRASNYLLEKILSQSHKLKKQPLIIQIFSHWDKEGKSFVSKQICKTFENIGKKCVHLNFSSSPIKGQDNSANAVNIDLIGISNYQSFIKEKFQEKYANIDYAVVELPPISEGISNPALMENADINYLIVEAQRTWSGADKFNLEKLKKVLGDNMQSVLTNARPNDLEDIFGEIPKKRSFIRSLVKHKLLKRFI